MHRALPGGLLEGAEDRVVLTTDGCLECGTCRVICTTHRDVEWEYPRGGYGIQVRLRPCLRTARCAGGSQLTANRRERGCNARAAPDCLDTIPAGVRGNIRF